MPTDKFRIASSSFENRGREGSFVGDVEEIQRRFGVVGRTGELRRALAAVRAGKHLLIEGPVGVGKTVIATSVAGFLKRPVFRVDGDERYTEQKLVGWFDPPLVLKNGYVRDAFIEGPLATAMLKGGVLFINELNRMPEGVQNVLLPAMDERRVMVPKIGGIKAEDGFIVIATQNPLEFIGTSLLSEALRDRFELVPLEYQGEDEEIAIVEKHTGIADRGLVVRVVKVARETRVHQDVRRGASVRAAISMAVLASNMESPGKKAVKEAAYMALPTRIELRDYTKGTVFQVIDEILKKCVPDEEESSGDDCEGGCEKSSSSLSNRLVSVSFGDALSDLFAEVEGIIDLKGLSRAEVGLAFAKNYYEIQRRVKDGRLVSMAKRIAVRAIIYKILQCLGPAPKQMKTQLTPYAPGVEGEIDLESSVDEMLGKAEFLPEDLVLESKRLRKAACVLMVDASTSMSGDKLSMATASLGVLAYKLRYLDYGIVAFSDCAKVVKGVKEKVNLEFLVGDLLDTRAMGLTNLEEALKAGLKELDNVKAEDKIGVVITDGHYTVGKDPRELAALYPKLFVIMIEDYDAKPDVCEDLARLGKGKMYKVADFTEIPKILSDALRSLSQRQHN
jgi:MoxR-like ATPase